MEALRSGDRLDIRRRQSDLTPDVSNLRQIIETPKGQREAMKQNEIMNQMLRENRPLNRRGMNEKLNAAYDRIDKQEVSEELNLFNKYKTADLDSAFDIVPLTQRERENVDRIARNWFNDYTPGQLKEIIERNRREFEQARGRGLEAIQEHNVRDLRDLNLVHNMQIPLKRSVSARRALKMHREANDIADSLFNSDLSYEQMLKKMNPFIKANSQILRIEDMKDVKRIIGQMSKEDDDVLKAIVDDEILPLDWYDKLEEAIRKKAAQEELASRSLK